MPLMVADEKHGGILWYIFKALYGYPGSRGVKKEL
jgi:hypothetical protein